MHRRLMVSIARLATSAILAALVLVVAAGPSLVLAASADTKRLQQLASGPQRSAGNVARDAARHPVAVLTFFKITPTTRVIEVSPGGAGYWTEILAPYLRDYGRYTAAIPKSDTVFKAKLAAEPLYYQRAATVEFSSGAPDLGPPDSADTVLTFRNLHNWMAAGKADAVLAAIHKVLRRGGMMGIEEHRGLVDTPQDPLAKSGYVRQDYAIAMIEKAGFRFAGTSEVNANPKDIKTYPDGVWTLPPTYQLKDVDRAKYTAIGESDRFVLKFVKR